MLHGPDVRHVHRVGDRADHSAGPAHGVWHHSRAHRFFATARWNLDQAGLILLHLLVGWLVPVGAPMVVAVDDTLFRRTGRRVYGACWAYDGSRRVAAGQECRCR